MFLVVAENMLQIALGFISSCSWVIFWLTFILIFKKEISGFLNDLAVIKTKWFELQKLKQSNQELRNAMKESFEAWVHFYEAYGSNIGLEHKKEYSEKFVNNLNNIADIVYDNEQERSGWFEKLKIKS